MGETAGGVLRRGSDRIIGGVCSGLAGYFSVDALLVRVVFIVLAIAHGVGIILYLILWLLMEPPPGATVNRDLGGRLRAMGDEIREDMRSGFSRSQSPPPSASVPSAEAGGGPPSPRPSYWRSPQGLWIGVISIVLGAYFLLDNLGVFRAFRWDIFWPVVLIALGLLLLVRRR
jgi:phage shock protein PspC (stress-responsive transcriptional regulator)